MNYKSLYSLIVLILLIVSCTSKKKTASKKEKKGFLARAYHNTTARYNRLYNARLMYNRVEQNIERDVKDDYTVLLPVYKYSKPEAKGQTGDLDEAIKKLSTNVSYHPYSKWVDDSYLLMGKCHLLKNETASAIENLDYVAVEYTPEKIALRKAKRKLKKGKTLNVEQEKKIILNARKKKYGIFAHKPVNKTAQLYLAQARIAENNLKEAQEIVDNLKSDTTMRRKQKALLWLTDAYLKSLDENENAEITDLERAQKFLRKRKEKGRVAYILAQLYQKRDSTDRALAYYQKAIKSKPVYEMDLYARLNKLVLENKKDSSLNQSTFKKLEKMRQDEKNEEYKDAIYYFEGNIYLQKNNHAVAMERYRKALATPGSNPSIKSAIYATLADNYYQIEKYETAYNYYDSALVATNEKHPRFSYLNKQKESLKEIIAKIKLIENQDSLQRLARMTPDEREAFIKALEQKKLEEENKNNVIANNNQQPNLNINNSPNQNMANGWYFSNPTAMAQGFTAFKTKWGQRVYEDNWRLTDKSLNTSENQEDEEISENESESKTNENKPNKKKNKTNIDITGIPDTPEKLEASNASIENALLSLAMLYNTKLSNYKKANESYEELLRRFPETPKRAMILYNMVLNARKMNQTEKANQYYAQLLNQYPNSSYINILNNPDMALKSSETDANVLKHYNETYAFYTEQKYEDVIARSENIEQLYGNEREMAARLSLIRAISIGKLKGEDQYIKALQNTVDEYPETKTKSKAEEMLALVVSRDKNYVPKPYKSIVEEELKREAEARKSKQTQENQTNTEQSANNVKDSETNNAPKNNTKPAENKPAEPKLNFAYNADEEHYVLIYFVESTGNFLNKYTNILNNYNRTSASQVTGSSKRFEGSKECIVVKQFPNRKDAAKYMQTMKASDSYKSINTKNYVFSISTSNYDMLSQQFSISQYIKFYNSNYK